MDKFEHQHRPEWIDSQLLDTSFQWSYSCLNHTYHHWHPFCCMARNSICLDKKEKEERKFLSSPPSRSRFSSGLFERKKLTFLLLLLFRRWLVHFNRVSFLEIEREREKRISSFFCSIDVAMRWMWNEEKEIRSRITSTNSNHVQLKVSSNERLRFQGS